MDIGYAKNKKYKCIYEKQSNKYNDQRTRIVQELSWLSAAFSMLSGQNTISEE